MEVLISEVARVLGVNPNGPLGRRIVLRVLGLR